MHRSFFDAYANASTVYTPPSISFLISPALIPKFCEWIRPNKKFYVSVDTLKLPSSYLLLDMIPLLSTYTCSTLKVVSP